MKYKNTLFTSLLFLMSCNQPESTKSTFDIKKEIDEINQLIEENTSKSNTIRDFKESLENTKGPYPADGYNFNPNDVYLE